MSMKRKPSKARQVADKAREALGIGEQPVYGGPTTRDAAKGASITHPAQQDEIASELDETLYYGDPTKDIPEEMDGVVQIKTAGEIATEKAYEAVLKDPRSVINEPVVGPQTLDSMAEAEHRMAKRQYLRAQAREGVKARNKRLLDTLGSVEGAGTVGEWGPDGIIIGGDPDAYPDLSQVTGSLDEEIARAKAFQQRAREESEVMLAPGVPDPSVADDIAQRREALAKFHVEQQED